MAKRELGVIITAKDAATAVFSKVQEATKKLTGAFKEVSAEVASHNKFVERYSRLAESASGYMKGFYERVAEGNREMAAAAESSRELAEATDEVGKSLSSTVAEIALGVTAGMGLTYSLNQLGNALRNIVTQAALTEQAMLGLAVTTKIVGESSTEANEAAIRLAAEGLMTQAQAASYLTDIMMTGLGLPEATALIERIADVAAFGGKATYSFEEKFRGLTEALISGYSQMAKHAGFQVDMNEAVEIGAEMMGKLTKELTIGEEAQARYLGFMEITAAETGNAALFLEAYGGSAHATSVAINQLSADIGASMLPALQNFYLVVLEAANALKGPLTIAIKVVAELFSRLTFGAQAAVIGVGGAIRGIRALVTEGVSAMNEEITSASMKLEALTKRHTETLDKIWEGGISDITDSIKTGTADWLDHIKETGQRAASSVGDQLAEITRRIGDERIRFKENLEIRKRYFQRHLEDLLFAHRDHRDRLEADMEKENERFEESLAKREKSYKAHIEKIKDRATDREKKVLKTYDKEVIRIRKKLNERLYFSTMAYEDAVYLAKKETEEKARERDEDLAEVRENLGKELDEENTAHQESMTELKSVHDERLSEIDSELQKELALQKRYAVDFRAIRGKTAMDDIALLKRRNAEEMVEMGRQSQRAIAELNKRAAQIRAKGAITIPIRYQPTIAPLPTATITAGIKRIAKQFEAAMKTIRGMPWKLLGFQPFQHGGIVPGRIGTPVPIIAHAGERIVSAEGAKVGATPGAGVTINFHGDNIFKTQADMDYFVEELESRLGRAMAMRKVGG